MSAKPITVPIALSCTRTATLTLPWFVQDTLIGSDDRHGKAEYAPMPATYKPLINGELAFGAIHDAILNAQRSVDIVCWGFQPSMYLKRGRSHFGAPCLGDLLMRKASEGVKVRVLCWADNYAVSQHSENNLPGYNVARSVFIQGENIAQLDYDQQWFGVVKYGGQIMDRLHDSYQADVNAYLGFWSMLASMPRHKAIQTLQNIRFVTRGFSSADTDEIGTREARYRSDRQLSTWAIRLGYQHEPTHHQKTVVVDYDLPERSVGFVMGHNLLDAYWDDDKHSYVREQPAHGRNGATPRQDMSCMITGRLLEHLNVNFCNGWKRAVGEDLLTARKPLVERLAPRKEEGAPVMAQITRTQSQEGRRDIKTLYLQAVRNATNFIYIENQYFRWPPLAEAIKEAARTQVAAGRDPGRHGSIYLFVVTNADKDALNQAQVPTYRMLESLGRADTMPAVARLERGDVLQAQRELAVQHLNKAELDISVLTKHGDYGHLHRLAELRAKEAKEHIAAIDQRIQENNDTSRAILPEDIPGLKVLICTLVAPDKPAPWMNTYVHSKIMVVDDVFLTHGSANINTRSMEVDSEINICHECADVTRPVREHLWRIHTDGLGVGQDGEDCARLDAASAYDQWVHIINVNQKQKKDGRDNKPYAPLIGFLCPSPTRGYLD